MPKDTGITKLNFKNSLFWIIAIVVTAFNGLFCTVSLVEIYQLAFTEIEKEYHWGADPFPWYYETKTTYLTYIGSWTLVFFLVLFFQIFYTFKANKTKELYSGLLFILSFVLMMLINGPMD